MGRLVALLLVLGCLGLVPPPAGATDRPRLSASRASVPSGTPVVLRGTVPRAGARLVLQRRTPSAWRTVAAGRSTARGVVRFRLVPPDGDQRYRLRDPGRGGRAGRSSAVSVRVTWQPTVTVASASHATAPGGAVTTSVTGSSGRLAGVVLRREVRGPDGSLVTTGTTRIGPDGRWSDTFASRDGDQVRYLAPRSGARLEARSTTVAVAAPTPEPPLTPDPVTGPTPPRPPRRTRRPTPPRTPPRTRRPTPPRTQTPPRTRRRTPIPSRPPGGCRSARPRRSSLPTASRPSTSRSTSTRGNGHPARDRGSVPRAHRSLGRPRAGGRRYPAHHRDRDRGR